MMKINWQEILGLKAISISDCRKLIEGEELYYVYIIWKSYTDIPEPFYVGKGRRYRFTQHEKPSEMKIKTHKVNIIEKHHALGINPLYSIVEFFKDEDDALQLEMELIEQIGRADLGEGPLTNRTDGGDGTRGHLALSGGDNPSARPVVANDITFECLNDASKELGKSAGAIAARIKKGWPGYYFVDEGQRDAAKGNLYRYEKQVSIHGQQYKSLSEASRILNIDYRSIHKRINYGWEGYFYLDEGQKPRKTIWGSRDDKVAVMIDGITYETIAEACRERNESVAMVSKRALSSNYPNYKRLDGKIEVKREPPKNPEEVSIDGTLYESINAAARAFELTSGGVIYRCGSSEYADWFLTSKVKQSEIEFDPAFSSNPLSVMVNDVVYESQSEAAREYDTDVNTVKRRCKSPSFPNWISPTIKKEQSKDGKIGIRSVEIDGVYYRSINQACNETGIARETIKKRLESDEYPNYRKAVPA